MTVHILVGHVLERLRGLPAESVHCVVTSPPYYGLRDYGIEPQVWGAGAGLDCVEHEWGDSVAGVKRSGGTASSTLGLASGGHDLSDEARTRSIERSFHEGSSSVFCLRCGAWRGSLGLEPALALYLDHMVEVFREVRRVMRKDATCWLNIGDSYAGKQLQMIPARLAIRLQDDGWWVRSDIAWCKRAPMPESCTDRPTSAWEHVFLLTKSARYYYDAEAVKEDAGGGKRNQRNVWLLGPEPFPEAHFATYPTEIPRRAILAGSKSGGTILDPFLGAGTTALVADRLGRDCIGIELNPEYAAMARRRIGADAPLFAEVAD